jgi:hypothetical protein
MKLLSYNGYAAQSGERLKGPESFAYGEEHLGVLATRQLKPIVLFLEWTNPCAGRAGNRVSPVG